MCVSNLSVRSNVYTVQGEHPLQDHGFVERVSDLKALIKLRDMRFRNFELKDWQRELILRGTYCAFHDDLDVPFGLVETKDGLQLVCRCTQIETCRYASLGKCWDVYRR